MKLLRRNKSFAALAYSTFFNRLGTAMYNLVFVAFAATMSESELAVAIANIIVLIPVLVTFIVGIKADETREKTKFFVYLGFVQALLFVGVAFLTQSATWLSFSIICLFNIFSDIIGDYRGGLELPIFQHTVAEEDLMEAHSINQFLSYICNLVGQALGVYLLAFSNDNFMLVAGLNAILFLASTLVLFKYRQFLTHDPITQSEKKTVIVQFKEVYIGLREVFQKSETDYFGLMLVVILLLNGLGSALTSIYNIYFLTRPLFELSFSQSILTIQMIMVIFSMIGALTPHDYFAKLRLVSIIYLDSLAILVIAINNSLGGSQILSLASLAFIAYLGGKINPKLNSLLMASLPSDVLARSGSFLSLLFMLAMPLGTTVFSIVSLANMQWTWALYLVITILVVVMSRKLVSD